MATESIALMVIAHAPLAGALCEVARHVFGEDAPVTPVDILPGASAEDHAQSIARRIRRVDEGRGVLIMTDLPGASPSNISVSAAHTVRGHGHACQVIGGVNAAMVLRAINYRGQPLEVLAEQAMQGGVRVIVRLDDPSVGIAH